MANQTKPLHRVISPSTTTQSFATSGTTRLTIDDGGDIGIGTTSPAQGLHLASGKQARFDDHVSIQPTKRLYIDGGGDTFIEETSANTMTFTTANGERARITADGDVGIGCTPGSGTRLEIRDSANSAIMELSGTDGRGLKLFTRKSNYPTNSGQHDGAVVYDAQDTEHADYPQHIFQTGGTTRMQINASGVGIGTSTPDDLLDVMGAAYDQIRIGSNKTDNTNKQCGIVSTTYTNQSLSLLQGFFQNGTNTLYYGSADGAHRGMQNHIFYVNSNYNATSGHTEAMRIASNTYIGMGIANTNNQRLTLAEADSNGSHIKMNNSRSGGGYWVTGVGDTNSSSSITPAGGLFFYNGTTRMVINSSGQVGIGTTAPAGLLDVNGTSYFRSTMHMAGSGNLQFVGGVYPTFVESGNDLILKRADTLATMYTFTARTSNVAVTSDVRLKDNITTITGATAKVKQLRGITHTWKEAMQHPDYPDAVNLGLIAQEVELVVPEVVHTPQVTEETPVAHKGVSYSNLVPLLIESIKELEARIATLEG